MKYPTMKVGIFLLHLLIVIYMACPHMVELIRIYMSFYVN